MTAMTETGKILFFWRKQCINIPQICSLEQLYIVKDGIGEQFEEIKNQKTKTKPKKKSNTFTEHLESYRMTV